jgi:hypothetical protein
MKYLSPYEAIDELCKKLGLIWYTDTNDNIIVIEPEK